MVSTGKSLSSLSEKSNVLILAIAFFLITTKASAQITQDISCYHCHRSEYAQFKQNVHYQHNLTCVDCHGGSPKLNLTTLSVNVMFSENFIGAPSRIAITSVCARCHPKETALYEKSIHWKQIATGHTDAATCTDCHGVHNITSSAEPTSLINPMNIPFTCSVCHENQTKMSAWYYGIKSDRFDTYKKSYHFRALELGQKGLATCPDCHENHETRAVDDPKSSVYFSNLPFTCGKPDCHPGESALIRGRVHEEQSVDIGPVDAKKLVTYFYIIMILFELAFTLGLIVLGITAGYELRKRGK